MPTVAVPGVAPVPGPTATGAAAPQGQASAAATKRPMVVAIIAAVAAVAVAAAFLVFRFVIPHDTGTSTPQGGAAGAQSAPKSDSSDSSSDSTDSSGSGSSKGKSGKPCTATPSAKVSAVTTSSDGSTILVKLAADTNCDSGDFTQKDVRVTLTDDGATVADGVFDFTGNPIRSTGDYGWDITLAYPDSAYWRTPADLSDDADDLDVRFETGVTANGASSGVPSDVVAVAAAPVSDTDANAAAKAAIDHQIAEDRDDADDFMTTVTTQLSSKRDGLDVDGKTWHYTDIYRQYLDTKAKYPNTLLVDSSDWPTYQNRGTTGWYVLLSGEGFPDADAANSWCSAQGLSQDDCIAVDLQ